MKLQRPRVQNFLQKTEFPKSKKALPKYLGVLNYYRSYASLAFHKLTPSTTHIFKLLENIEVLVTPNPLEKLTEMNKAFDRCCEIARKNLC